jgi:hypothetical protein
LLSPVEIYGKQLKEVRTIRRDAAEEAEHEIKRQLEQQQMIRAKMAE